MHTYILISVYLHEEILKYKTRSKTKG